MRIHAGAKPGAVGSCPSAYVVATPLIAVGRCILTNDHEDTRRPRPNRGPRPVHLRGRAVPEAVHLFCLTVRSVKVLPPTILWPDACTRFIVTGCMTFAG